MATDLEQLIELVKEAGTKTLSYFGNARQWVKEDKSIVTEADIASNDIIVQGLKAMFPYDGILSEETADDGARLTKERVWIIDPVDGTVDFSRGEKGLKEYTVVVGLSVDKKSVMGVVYAPARNELFFAQHEKGAYAIEAQRTKKLAVSDTGRVEDMTLVGNYAYPDLNTVKNWVPVKKTLLTGSSSMCVCKVAEGEADVYMSRTGKDWDYCAPDIILKEAGGTMTHLADNTPVVWNNPDVVKNIFRLSSNNKAHEQLITYTRSYAAAEGTKPVDNKVR